MKFWRVGFVFGMFFSLLTARSPAGDWPEFRGPAGRGISDETGLPDRWDGKLNVAWKKELPGSGWSSPVVHAGRIYLTAAVPSVIEKENDKPSAKDKPMGDYELSAICLDEASGDVIWQVPVFKQSGTSDAKIHQKNSHASPTPIVDGKRLFVHFGHQGTACLGLDGRILWKSAQHVYEPVHGNGGSPVLVDEALIFSCDGASNPRVVALEAATGQEIWKVERPVDAVKKFSFSTPAVIDVNGTTQVISPGSDVVSSYEPRTGREIWRVRYDGYSVIPQPAFAHGMVFVCTGYNTPEVLAIRADGTGDVTDTHIAWRVKRGVPNTPSPVIVGDELYMVSDHGVASCLDARTGKAHWQKRLGGNYSASPLVGDGKIYFQSEEGTGSVLSLGKEVQEPVVNELGERSLASYAIAHRSLLIRTSGHLYCIRVR
ncbi:MAG: PQQ-binding-like beta-propeller repeat protein [Planctomycetota bacterium]